MKIAKSISIDSELLRQIEASGNVSKLINDALHEYFKSNQIRQLTPEQLNRRIELKKEIASLQKELDEIW